MAQQVKFLSHRPFCVEFACSPHACVAFLQVLRFPLQPLTCTKDQELHVEITLEQCICPFKVRSMLTVPVEIKPIN